MGTPAVCPHDNPSLATNGPYYRQVHPNNFQNGQALPGSFILSDTGCHYGLSLHDGARTTAKRCHDEYTKSGRQSAAVLEVSEQELIGSGTLVIVDSPDGITFAHVDAMYTRDLSNKQKSDVQKALLTAANKRGPAHLPIS